MYIVKISPKKKNMAEWQLLLPVKDMISENDELGDK